MSHAATLLLRERAELVRVRNNTLVTLRDEPPRTKGGIETLEALVATNVQAIAEIDAVLSAMKIAIPKDVQPQPSKKPVAFGKESTPESRRRAYFENKERAARMAASAATLNQ